MRDPSSGSGDEPTPAGSRSRGWPLWLRLGLAALVLAFVWSPFLAMVARLSQIGPTLQPTGGSAPLIPPPQAPAPGGGGASRPAPAPSP